MLTMRSPALRPALAAGPSGTTLAMSAPVGRCNPRLSAMSAVTAWSLAPSHGRLTAPFEIARRRAAGVEVLMKPHIGWHDQRADLPIVALRLPAFRPHQ